MEDKLFEVESLVDRLVAKSNEKLANAEENLFAGQDGRTRALRKRMHGLEQDLLSTRMELERIREDSYVRNRELMRVEEKAMETAMNATSKSIHLQGGLKALKAENDDLRMVIKSYEDGLQRIQVYLKTKSEHDNLLKLRLAKSLEESNREKAELRVRLEHAERRLGTKEDVQYLKKLLRNQKRKIMNMEKQLALAQQALEFHKKI